MRPTKVLFGLLTLANVANDDLLADTTIAASTTRLIARSRDRDFDSGDAAVFDGLNAARSSGTRSVV